MSASVDKSAAGSTASNGRLLLVMGAWSLGFGLLLVGMGLWLLVRGHVAGHEAMGLLIVVVGIAGPGVLGVRRIRLSLRPDEGLAGLKHRRVSIVTSALLMIGFGVVAFGEGIWLLAHGQVFVGTGLVVVGMAGLVVLGARLRYAIRATRSNLPQKESAD